MSGVCRVAIAGVLAWASVLLAEPLARVTVSAEVVGRTPPQVGYNLGHFWPGSNTAGWWAYSGVNAARIWSNASIIEPYASDDLAPWGDGVAGLASFQARRAALRADPLNPGYVNWPFFANRYAAAAVDGNRMYLAAAFEALKAMGIEPVVVISRSETSYPWGDPATPAGWGDRWEHWQHYYAQAFHLGRQYGVERFHTFNEPDHSSHPDLGQAEYLERLQLASDAIQCAIADVNRIFGGSLVAQVQAPVSAGGASKFYPIAGGDPRDDALGWGELVMGSLHRDYTGLEVPDFNLISTYAYQQYNLDGSGFASNLEAIRAAVDAHAGGLPIKLALTEFNVNNAAALAAIPETLDTPSKAARMGAILAHLANSQPDEIYVFKFSQTDNGTDGSVKKNGTHWVSNDTAPYNIGGATRTAEVVHLFAQAFAGGKPLLGFTQIGGASAGLSLAACREPNRSRYFLLCSNENADRVTLSLDLAAWHIAPGALACVHEVSPRWLGELVGVLEMPADGAIELSVPGAGVVLLSLTAAPPFEQVVLTATDDAMIKAGGNANANFGASANLWVKANRTNPAARNVSLIKFDLRGQSASGTDQAVLSVTGHNPGGSATVVTHVYGLSDDGWSEGSVTWNNAPNLGNALGSTGSGVIERIADNFVEGIGVGAEVLGHLSADGTPAELRLDATGFVRRQADGFATFLVAREVRFDGDTDDVNFLRMASRNDPLGSPPRLTLRVIPDRPVPDYDRDHDVDVSDFAHLQGCFTDPFTAVPAHCRNADLNEDGLVDQADVTAFLGCFGDPGVVVNLHCTE